jgi:tyrosine-protein kinase Etk/Wzc
VTDSQAKSQQPALAKLAVDDEIDLLGYLRVVWRYRWMILALCIIAMSLTVVLTLRKPRQYQSAVTIVPPLDILQKESGGALGSLNNSLLRQVMNTGAGSIARLYVEILDSREVADAIIDRFRLMDLYEGIQYRSRARDWLKGNTIIKTTDGGAVRVTVLDRDPNRAAAIANAYVEELDKRNKKLSASQATSKRVFLENRLNEVEAKLSKVDNILSREAKTQEMLYLLLAEQYEMAKMEEARSMPTIQVLDSAVVPELPVGRDAVRQGRMAGLAAFVLGIFLAFSREYIVRARRREAEVAPASKHGSKVTAPAAVAASKS